MTRCRHRRLRARLAILAIVALLWSQFVLAGHPVASFVAMASVEAIAPMAEVRDCQHPKPVDESTLCISHCSQGDQSSDVARVPPVPASMPAPAAAIASVVVLEARHTVWVALPPAASWHRPTAHPASLLLI